VQEGQAGTLSCLGQASTEEDFAKFCVNFLCEEVCAVMRCRERLSPLLHSSQVQAPSIDFHGPVLHVSMWGRSGDNCPGSTDLVYFMLSGQLKIV
jgi:hypothetical protein